MRVQIWKRYAGNRTAQPVEVGVYDYGAGELFGLEVFLRDNGNARFLDKGSKELEAIEKARADKERDEKVKKFLIEKGEITDPDNIEVADPIPAKAEAEIEADEEAHGISGTKRRGRKKS